MTKIYVYIIIWLIVYLDLPIEFLINLIHLQVNEFDYLWIEEVHVMIEFLFVVSDILDGTKKIKKKELVIRKKNVFLFLRTSVSIIGC